MLRAAIRVPSDPLALAAALPDMPRWIEARSLLLSGEGMLRVAQDGDAGILLDPRFPSGFVVGRADAALLRDALAGVPEDFELVVQMEAVDGALAALSDWTVAYATIHLPASPWRAGAAPQPGVVVSAPPQRRWLEQLPDEIRRYAADAEVIAVSLDGEGVASVCAAGDVTETLWDVGVDTLEGRCRRGHAAACFRALAAHMAAAGQQPVWAAEEGNVASMSLAAKLGFQPVDRIALLSR